MDWKILGLDNTTPTSYLQLVSYAVKIIIISL